jgi:hypothetical protein
LSGRRLAFREVAVGVVRELEGRRESVLDGLHAIEIVVDCVTPLFLLGEPASGEDERGEENEKPGRSAHALT